jgi:RimJ/RimL family protein N-acetyltransferase
MIDPNPTAPNPAAPNRAAPSPTVSRPSPAASARARLGGITRWSPVRRPGWMRGPAIPDGVRRPVLETPRLLLRPHRLRDARAWHALQSDPEVLRYVAWPTRSRTASLKHLVDRTQHTSLLRKDDFLALAVVHEGRLVGDVSLHFRNVELPERHLEIGWIVASEHQGRGFAREAAEAVLELAFDDLRARQVTARMDSGNAASKALAERLGFVEVTDVAGSRLMALGVARYREQHAQRS